MTNTELAALLKRHGLSVEHLAVLVGRRQRVIYLWLEGVHPVPRAVALLLTALDEGVISFLWLIDALKRIPPCIRVKKIKPSKKEAA